MAQRTVGQARAQLEALTPGLNPEMFARYTAEIRAAQAAARAQATQYLDRRFAPANETGTKALTDLCALRDEALSLVADVQAGRMPARDATARFNELHNLLRALARHAGEVARVAESIEAVEADPVAFADSLAEKFPTVPRHDFSF